MTLQALCLRPSLTALRTFGASLSDFGRCLGWRPSFLPRAFAVASPDFTRSLNPQLRDDLVDRPTVRDQQADHHACRGSGMILWWVMYVCCDRPTFHIERCRVRTSAEHRAARVPRASRYAAPCRSPHWQPFNDSVVANPEASHIAPKRLAGRKQLAAGCRRNQPTTNPCAGSRSRST